MNLEEMQQAVINRDKIYDFQFVYGVKSTGIFCKPSCPSRQAKLENMVFFGGATQATAEGFRACLKCSPTIEPADVSGQLVQDICAILTEAVNDNEGRKITLKDIAKQTGYSNDHISRSFKKIMGVSPIDYFDSLRNTALKTRLKDGQSVADAGYEVGFGSSSRLYEAVGGRLGMTPASYAKGGKGAEIAYVIVDCFLGRMLAAGTGQGVCAVYFGDEDAALLQELREEFPHAEIGKEIGELEGWTRQMIDFLQSEKPVPPSIPLDMFGTAFQRRVWQELLKIAPGEIKTYKQIAEDMGQGKSSRAVGRACATNPVSLIVPCHRVIGSDGKLHGYRWGLERKTALQTWERNSA
jgi:AraC family transcriptional regulator, regulatory protein of adaptative response / methylated-DNA-[protein]-cysteine methyltransferase